MEPLIQSVLQHESVEFRVDALEAAHVKLDERYAAALLPGLDLLLTRLTALPALREAALSLRAQLARDGARALTEAELPAPAGDPLALAREDAATLPQDDPLLARLAGDLLFLAGGAEDYAGDVLLPALTRAAESVVDLRELDALRDALREVVDEVATAPRSRRITPRFFTVLAGQDLRDIAEGVYGDRERFPDLIEAYHLYPPYLADTPREGVLAPGTRLLLPPDVEDLEAEGLGITFALDVQAGPHGGQVWDLIAQDGVGLATDRGLSAFATDLALRLATPLGSLDGEPNYGVLPVAGVDASVAGVYAQVAAVEAIREDERVERVVVNPRGSSALTGVFVGGVIAVPRPELLEL